MTIFSPFFWNGDTVTWGDVVDRCAGEGSPEDAEEKWRKVTWEAEERDTVCWEARDRRELSRH